MTRDIRARIVRLALRLLPAWSVSQIRNGREWVRYLTLGRAATIQIGPFLLELPRAHALRQLALSQPFRDECIGIAAHYMQLVYPHKCVLDIGANVGDTCARVGQFSTAPVYCVEAHPLFFSYLERNAQIMPSVRGLFNVVVGDGSLTHGRLSLSLSSTARFSPSELGKTLQTVHISELSIGDVGLLKIDTDGADYAILQSHLAWLEAQRPLLLFESEVRSASDYRTAVETLELLWAIGYTQWLVFDDPGHLLLAAHSMEQLKELHAYLLSSVTYDRPRRISNYDILAAHADDTALFERIRGHYAERSQRLNL